MTGCHCILIPPVISLSQKPSPPSRHVRLSSVEDRGWSAHRNPLSSVSLWRMKVSQAFFVEREEEYRL